jgi:hypothetical protein
MQDERNGSDNTVTPDEALDEESNLTNGSPRAPTFAGDTELQNRKTSRTSSLRRKLGMSTPTSPTSSIHLSSHLSHLVSAYEKSDIATDVQTFHKEAKDNSQDAETDLDRIASFQQASWWTQFTILSGRAFKNLYRNPMLMLAHYVVSIVVACKWFCLLEAQNVFG